MAEGPSLQETSVCSHAHEYASLGCSGAGLCWPFQCCVAWPGLAATQGILLSDETIAGEIILLHFPRGRCGWWKPPLKLIPGFLVSLLSGPELLLHPDLYLLPMKVLPSPMWQPVLPLQLNHVPNVRVRIWTFKACNLGCIMKGSESAVSLAITMKIAVVGELICWCFKGSYCSSLSSHHSANHSPFLLFLFQLKLSFPVITWL